MQIFPIFLPETDCPYDCGFCNPAVANGPCATTANPDEMMIRLSDWLRAAEAGDPERREVAFYGGTFTWGGPERMLPWLEPLQEHVRFGRITGIRVSTRPDRLSDNTVHLLKTHRVTSMEIGIQSFDDRVLETLGRSHSAAQGVDAVTRCREAGFVTGIHLMTGIPGESTESWKKTVATAVGLHPDSVRLHPLLVLENTRFAEQAVYPLPDHEVVDRLACALIRFAASEIPVIRVGLQATDALMAAGAVKAGLFHPALRHLVMSRIYGGVLRSGRFRAGETVRVHPSHLSHARGFRGENRRAVPDVIITGDSGVAPWTLKSGHSCYHILSEGLI